MLQAKLTVNTPGDKYEQEADRVADMVMRMPEPRGQAASSPTPLLGGAGRTVQRKCATCAAKGHNRKDCPDCKKKPGLVNTLQRHSTRGDSAAGMAAPPIVSRVLNTPGSPLPGDTRSFMESRFGTDFGHVRVHTDSLAAESAAAVQAKAYTVGNHIALSHPQLLGHRILLAHELTHVVQQQGTGSTSSIVSRSPQLWGAAAGGVMGAMMGGIPGALVGGVVGATAGYMLGSNRGSFQINGCSFNNPAPVSLTPASALAATTRVTNEFSHLANSVGRSAGSGVVEGEVASYGVVVRLEKVGDLLTGDHQPSGAAVKEAIRIELHGNISGPLTRQMANTAYQKAITVVVDETWHRNVSRTYGGRNTKSQIQNDSQNLAQAAVADWTALATDLVARGLRCADLQKIWNHLEAARAAFYSTGQGKIGSM